MGLLLWAARLAHDLINGTVSLVARPKANNVQLRSSGPPRDEATELIAVLVAAIAIIASAMAVLYALARFVHWMWQ